MTFNQFIAVMRARWRLSAIVFFSTVALIVLGSLVWPKKYRAEASVVVDIKPDPIAGVVYGAMVNPAIVATQVDIIQSDRVTRRVIKNLKLDQSPIIQEQWKDDTGGEGDIVEWLAARLVKQLDVKPARESNVISVTYKAPDSKFAAAITNAFVDAYLQTALELRVDPARQYMGFFDVQTKQARDALTASQKKLSEYEQQHNVTVSDERFDVETARLNELATQLVMIQSLSADSSGRQAQANAGNADKLADSLNNSVVQGLRVDLSRERAKLKELSSQYGSKHPQVLQAEASIQELEARVASETNRISGSVSVANTVNRAREAEIRQQLEEQRTKVTKLKQERDQASLLQRDVDAAQHAFDAVAQRLTQANLESQTQQSNVSLLSPAAPPSEPSSPKLLLNTLAALILGAVLAVVAALASELRDRRVRNGNDIGELIGLPVLGVLPRPLRSKRDGGQAALMANRVLFGRLSAPKK